jgi:hypothetical protein
MFNNEFEQGEFMSNGCKVNNVLNVFEDAKVGARGARTLVACTPRLNSVPTDARGCQRGKIKIGQN